MKGNVYLPGSLTGKPYIGYDETPLGGFPCDVSKRENRTTQALHYRADNAGKRIFEQAFAYWVRGRVFCRTRERSYMRQPPLTMLSVLFWEPRRTLLPDLLVTGYIDLWVSAISTDWSMGRFWNSLILRRSWRILF